MKHEQFFFGNFMNLEILIDHDDTYLESQIERFIPATIDPSSILRELNFYRSGAFITIKTEKEDDYGRVNEMIMEKYEKNENVSSRGINSKYLNCVEFFYNIGNRITKKFDPGEHNKYFFYVLRCEKEERITTIYILEVICLMKKNRNTSFKDLVVSDDYLRSLQSIFIQIGLVYLVTKIQTVLFRRNYKVGKVHSRFRLNHNVIGRSKFIEPFCWSRCWRNIKLLSYVRHINHRHKLEEIKRIQRYYHKPQSFVIRKEGGWTYEDFCSILTDTK